MQKPEIRLNRGIFLKQISSKAALGGSNRIRDSIFLGAVTFFSTFPYVLGLGLYDDDWGFLNTYTYCANRSIWGLAKCYYRDNGDASLRPLQNLYVSGLYWLFGPHRLAHHLFDAIAFAVVVILLYHVLSELNLSRPLAVSSSLMYGLLPQFSTDHFWLASAAETNSSMFFCLLSFYSAARISQAHASRRWLWVALSVIAMFASLLAYELAAPLMVMVPYLIYKGFRRSNPEKRGSLSIRSVPLWALLSSLASLALFVALKLKLQTRVGIHGKFTFLHHLDKISAYAVTQFYKCNLGELGLGLPSIALVSVMHRLSTGVLVQAAILGVLVAFYLAFVARSARHLITVRNAIGAILGGFLIFALGFSIWAADYSGNFANLGIANRITAAASLGTAFLIVGTAELLSALLNTFIPPRASFSAVVTAFAISGYLVLQGVGSFWVESAEMQKVYLRDIRAQVGKLPSGSTILLDGIPTYVGLAPVFLWEGETAPALQLLLDDQSLDADVVNNTTRAENQYILKFAYSFEYHYPYGDNLWLYNVRTKYLVQLKEFKVAQNYFTVVAPSWADSCAPPCGDFGGPAVLSLEPKPDSRFVPYWPAHN